MFVEPLGAGGIIFCKYPRRLIVDKLQYLKKIFAPTIGKTFENNAINQIWSKFGLQRQI
jgi:hypothetical protein